MYQPETHPYKFTVLLNDIEQGLIKIPQFQRDFVWSKEQSAKLMDSILKGYPIGTFILWKTKERLRSIRNIGGVNLPETPDGDFIHYVLDGQQRMTSLYASLKGVTVKRETQDEDFSEIYVDLLASEDEDLVIIDVSDKQPGSYIKLTELLNGGLSLAKKFDEKYHEKLSEYYNRIATYDFPSIFIKNSSIDIATEIFTRINIGGKKLSVFEIMVAKTFDAERDFDLSEKYDELIDSLSDVNYETISDATVLQTVSIFLVKECSKKHILKLDKQSFIDIWDDVVDSIERAVEYFRGFYRIPVSQLLPYNALIVPFAYYFYHHKDKPTGKQKEYLQDYFWRATLTERFSSGVETKLAQDIKRIDLILEDKLPQYEQGIDVRPEAIIQNGWFSAGRSYIKGILCILAYHRPLSFIDNSVVNISNDWLKQANSKNYHHFFPRAYLRKNGEDEFYINHILNITIVDDFLNKKKIKAKSPSQYMKEFKKVNPTLQETMKTHLINDLDEFGVWNNDYDIFFNKRAKVISEEIKKRIVYQQADITDEGASKEAIITKNEVASSEEENSDELIVGNGEVNDKEIEDIKTDKKIKDDIETRFFIDSDFNAFDEKFATSENDKIIGARQLVVDDRMKPLHNDKGNEKGLEDFFRKNGLYPHWQKQHLTNVFWPFPPANGGWVDYLRMGYGKEKELVKDLAQRSGIFTEITDTGTREAIAFFCVTQLQVGLNYDGWWTNLYIDKKGWLEQYNLLMNINYSKQNKSQLLKLLEGINKEGYEFAIYPYPYEDLDYDRNDPEAFINEMQNFKNNKKACSISIDKYHDRDAKENNQNMLRYLKCEFSKLIPLYNFISWHPKKNNYIGI